MTRDTEDPDMVERLVIAFDKIAPAWTSVADLEGYAKAALEACHHAELVKALQRSNKIARALARGHSVFPGDVAAMDASDAVLAKIGGEQGHCSVCCAAKGDPHEYNCYYGGDV